MSPLLVWATTTAGVLLALLGGATSLAGRRLGLAHLVAAGVVQLLLLVQAAAVVVSLAGGERPADVPTFLSYLIAVLLVPAAGVLWARADPTRWAGTVLAVAGLVVAVMAWRLLQLWEATGG